MILIFLILSSLLLVGIHSAEPIVGNTVAVVLNLAAANIYVLIAMRFSEREREQDGFRDLAYWWSTWVIGVYHVFTACLFILAMLETSFQLHGYAQYMHLILAPFIVPNVLADYTRLRTNAGWLTRSLHQIALNARPIFFVVFTVCVLAALSGLATRAGLLPQSLNLMRIIDVDIVLVLSGVVWALMEITGLRVGQGRIGEKSKFLRGHRVLMFILFGIFVFEFPFETDLTIGLLLPFLTLPFILIIGWRQHRLVLVDLIARKVVQLIIILGGAMAMMWALYAIDRDSIAPLIIIQSIIVIAFVLQWANRLMNDIWLPGSVTRESFNEEFPGKLVSSLNADAAIASTERTLGNLFKADVAINRPVGELANSIVAGKNREITINLGWIRGVYPWFPDALELVRDAGQRLDTHLQLLDLQQREHQQTRRNEQLSELRAKAELAALRAQIRPHFLFNVLNTIHSFIGEEPEKAEVTLELLAELMRGIVSGGDKDVYPLERELALAETYLKIEQIRFGKRLHYSINCDERHKRVDVPVFSLQPLVENAVKYSVEREVNQAEVKLATILDDDELVITVNDNGPGLDDSHASTDGLGIALGNIRDRLNKLYGERATLLLQANDGGGVCAELRIPTLSSEQQP